MAHRYEFTVQDVTCEKCEARVRDAVQELPGAQRIDLVRTPKDEAQVVFESAGEFATSSIERAIEARSAGTEHTYRVRWS